MMFVSEVSGNLHASINPAWWSKPLCTIGKYFCDRRIIARTTSHSTIEIWLETKKVIQLYAGRLFHFQKSLCLMWNSIIEEKDSRFAHRPQVP